MCGWEDVSPPCCPYSGRVRRTKTAAPTAARTEAGGASIGVWKGVGRGKCVGNKKSGRSMCGWERRGKISNGEGKKSVRGVCGLCVVVCGRACVGLCLYGVGECVRRAGGKGRHVSFVCVAHFTCFCVLLRKIFIIYLVTKCSVSKWSVEVGKGEISCFLKFGEERLRNE
jgi:hypothetical protein